MRHDLTVGELWTIIDTLHRQGQDDMPVWVAYETVVGHADGISVTRQGDWRGVYIGNVERDTVEGEQE